jgi:hypothetical protein
MKDAELTAAAQAGFDGQACQALATSPKWYAHQLGAHMQKAGMSRPRDAAMSRGNRVRCNDMVFEHHQKKGEPLRFERVS